MKKNRVAEEGAVELSGSFTGSVEQKAEMPPTNVWRPGVSVKD